MTDIDITIELVSHRKCDALRHGELKILFSGKDANDELINGIGRILMKRVPIYAFAHELIQIERIPPESGYIDSVPYNHDYMRLRLSQLPLIGIDPELSLLHEQYWKDVDYLDKNRQKHPDEKNIDVYIDAKNDTKEIMQVTTNNMVMHISDPDGSGDKKVQIYDEKYPFLIISLRENERFKCSMKAVLGVGLRHSIWNCASNYWYDQETYPEKTMFCFESSSGLDEFLLLGRALDNFKKTIMTYKQEIKRMYEVEKRPVKRFAILIKNEDHTVGEVINYEFQSHKHIIKSGNTKPDHLIREIVIDVEADNEKNLLPALMESIDKLHEKISVIESKVNSISSKNSNNEVQKEKPKKTRKN